MGPIEIDRERRELRIEGDSVHVTTKEFELLAYLADHPGRIFTRDQLLTRIWGYDYVGDGRTVDVRSQLQDIASELGLTREVLYRTLASLEQAGVIERAGARILLKKSLRS